MLTKLIAVALLSTSIAGVHGQGWENITGNVPGTLSTTIHGPMDTDGHRLYVLEDKGVFVSSDGGATFSALNAVDSASYTTDQYAFGSDPLAANSTTGPFRPRLVMVDEGGKRYPAIRFRRYKVRRSAVTIEIAASATVTFPTSTGTTEMPPTDLGNDLEEVTIRANTDEATSFKMFFRTSVRQSP